jgi:F-type H+-transporting ATPase subunit b
MTDLIQQLGALILGSTPTMLLFLTTLLAYRLLVYAPLTKVLAERRRRTQGAIEDAAKAIETAQARMTEYEQKLHAARQAIFHAREERLRILQTETEKVLAAARLATQQRLLVAHEEIDKGFAGAEMQISASIEQLGAAAIARVLTTATTRLEGAR